MRRPLNLTLPFVRRNFRATHIVTETELVCCVRGRQPELLADRYSSLDVTSYYSSISYIGQRPPSEL